MLSIELAGQGQAAVSAEGAKRVGLGTQWEIHKESTKNYEKKNLNIGS